MTRYHLKNNNVRVPFTAEEETARDEKEAQAVIDNQAREEAETARQASSFRQTKIKRVRFR